MAMVCVAQNQRGNGSGSSPSDAMAIGSVDWSAQPGNDVFLVGKIEQRVNVTASGTNDGNRITIRGDHPAERGYIDRDFDQSVDSALTMSNQSFITVRNLEVCRAFRIGVYRGETASDGLSDASITLDGVYIHDIYGHQGNDSNAFQAWGQNVKVRNSRIEEVGTDCIWLKGANGLIENVQMVHGAHAGIGNNDCIQLEASDNTVIRNVFMDISEMTVAKPQQAMLLLGNNVLAENVVVKGSPLHVSSSGAVAVGAGAGDGINVKIRNLVILNDAMGVFFNGNSSGTVESSIFVGPGASATRGGITGGANNVVEARHNIVMNYGGQTGIGISGVGSRARNNIITGCGTGLTAHGYSNNCVFGNGANFSASPSGTDIQLDPMFLDPAQPWLGLRADSPCWNAGIWIPGAKDRFGRMYPTPAHIGPWAQR